MPISVYMDAALVITSKFSYIGRTHVLSKDFFVLVSLMLRLLILLWLCQWGLSHGDVRELDLRTLFTSNVDPFTGVWLRDIPCSHRTTSHCQLSLVLDSGGKHPRMVLLAGALAQNFKLDLLTIREQDQLLLLPSLMAAACISTILLNRPVLL